MHFRFPSAALLFSLFLLGWIGFVPAHAAVITQQHCDGVTLQSEPMDIATESRFARYLSSGGFPHTFRTTAELERWCFLWRQEWEASDARSASRLQRRSLEERFETTEPENTPLDFTTDVTLEDLPVVRQSRILQRVKTENCDSGSGLEWELIEYAICRSLLEEKYRVQMQNIERKRVANRSLRSTPSARTLQENATVRRAIRLLERPVSEEGQIMPDATDTSSFDQSGVGSEPLADASREVVVQKRAEQEDCVRLSLGDEIARCQWLVQHLRTLRSAVRTRAATRVKTLNIGTATGIRRAVDLNRQPIGTAQDFIRQRRLQSGFRPTPRTLQEARRQFQEPVFVEGEAPMPE